MPMVTPEKLRSSTESFSMERVASAAIFLFMVRMASGMASLEPLTDFFSLFVSTVARFDEQPEIGIVEPF